MTVIDNHLNLIIPIMIGVNVILIVIVFAMLLRIRSLRGKYMKILGDTGVPNVEQVLSDVHRSLQDVQAGQVEQRQAIAQIEQSMKLMKSKVGVHRYNAYDQMGSDLSFSLAIVDDYSNGVVLTGIHSREQSYLYAKALENGESKHALSPEEKTAINQAVNKVSD